MISSRRSVCATFAVVYGIALLRKLLPSPPDGERPWSRSRRNTWPLFRVPSTRWQLRRATSLYRSSRLLLRCRTAVPPPARPSWSRGRVRRSLTVGLNLKTRATARRSAAASGSGTGRRTLNIRAQHARDPAGLAAAGTIPTMMTVLLRLNGERRRRLPRRRRLQRGVNAALRSVLAASASRSVARRSLRAVSAW